MKNLIASAVLLLSIAVARAQTEEQRKYVFSALNERTLQTVDGGAVLNGLTIKKHSVYEYYDLYLDTEELDLLKMNLSLRIRKRDYGNGTIEYGMQLKSEMLKAGDIRMEIDETELDYMQVYYRGHVIKLQNVLASIYESFQAKLASGEVVDLSNDADMQENLNILKTWLAFKANSAVAPLQKLRQLKLPLEKRQTLRPVIIGRSVRTRSHVYIDRQNTTEDLVNFAASTRSILETPEGVKGEDKVWTMEASFDRAQFYRVDAPGKHLINEFEVENKYLPHENSRELLTRFEDGLISELAAEVNLESKYLQTMKALGL
ncbi:MAG: CYTH domain-containing protein [Bacteriovoracia bacterium]